MSGDAPAGRGLYELFRSRFPADLDAPLLELEDGGAHSYRDLDRTSARYARLFAELGVHKGARVAVQVDKSPQAVFVYMAALRAGAVYLPLNPAYTPAELAYFLADAEPRVVVCRPESESAVGEIARTLPEVRVLTLGADGEGSLIRESARYGADFPSPDLAGNDLAAILYTSGTTGRSKGAMLSHGNLASNALTLRAFWDFQREDVLLHALPIFHAHGLFVAIHTTLVAGARMLFLPRFDVDTVIRLLPRATVLMGVPTFYTRLLSRPELTPERCAGIRLFISGSAPLLAETHRRFRDRTGHAILERYGMTETLMNTSNPLHGERLPGSVGLPLPGVEVRVADAEGRALGTGEIGILEVRGPNVFCGYWRMPEKTQADFRADGFFVTGDVGRIDERGYVHIVGRAKELIISGGLNVYPKEIESVIDHIDGVVESAVVGIPHPDFGEAVIAVVKRHPGRDDVTEDAVLRAARAALAAYKAPKRIFFAEELPRNAMGKVQKNLLQERYRRTFG
ncbi:MAG TPA: malonyl-CoA synthase [Candidatus Binatia bacterium]|nr:malonyl-CoA synthase [Candidatus Binatia bacterium]